VMKACWGDSSFGAWQTGVHGRPQAHQADPELVKHPMAAPNRYRGLMVRDINLGAEDRGLVDGRGAH
jgi:hypothetical protein